MQNQQNQKKESTLDPVELALAINKRSNDILLRTLGTEQEVHILRAQILKMEARIAELEDKLRQHCLIGDINPHTGV